MKGNTYCAELFDHAIPYILLYNVTHSLLLLMLTGPYLVFICIVKSKKNNIKLYAKDSLSGMIALFFNSVYAVIRSILEIII